VVRLSHHRILDCAGLLADVLQDLVYISLGEILDPPGPNERNDVTLGAASVGGDC
jgi:hypothetical protein